MELEELKKENEELKAQITSLKEEVEKGKKAISNACADASKFKKEAAEWQEKYKATLDENEKKAMEAEQEKKAMAEKLATLETEKRVSNYTARLMEIGYPVEVASLMAQALPDGVNDEFFNKQKEFLEAQQQKAKETALNNQPGLSNGTPPTTNGDDKLTADLKRWAGY